MEQRTWELIKGDYEFLPDCLKSLATWGDVYRCAYASFSAHKATICQAEAPTHIVFGPETWERINVSAEFKHSLLCLSRWYDDLVKGAVDSYDDLYLRSAALCPGHPQGQSGS